VGCRATDEKGDLIRVAHRDGAFILDASQREPGRGAYLHPGCVERALRTRGVQRTLKVSAVPSDQLAGLLATLNDERGV
jgi:uncharacterized protein